MAEREPYSVPLTDREVLDIEAHWEPWLASDNVGPFAQDMLRMAATIRHDRARLAEVEAELRDCKAQGVLEGNLDHVKWKRERKRAEIAEAKLAEMTADRDRESNWRDINADRFQCEHQRANAAERKLAAVRALCDDLAGDIEHSRVHGDGPPEYRAGWQHGVEFAAEQVRAVLAAVDGPAEPPAGLDECGQPFPCAHRAYNPDCNHPMSAGSGAGSTQDGDR